MEAILPYFPAPIHRKSTISFKSAVGLRSPPLEKQVIVAIAADVDRKRELFAIVAGEIERHTDLYPLREVFNFGRYL
jgi:hypothetical protein